MRLGDQLVSMNLASHTQGLFTPLRTTAPGMEPRGQVPSWQPPPTPPTSSSSPILLWGELGEWRGWVEAGLFVFLLSQEVVEMSQG